MIFTCSLGSDASAAYTYDDAGRLETVSDGTDTFTYGYKYTFSSGYRMGDAAGAKEDFIPYTVAGPFHEVVNMLKPDRDALQWKKNLKNGVPTTLVSIYVYQTVNGIGQRTNGYRFGSAFATGAVGLRTWTYDNLGQLASANEPGTAEDSAYQYDDIGNRKKSVQGGLTLPGSDNYSASALNQYTATPWDSVQVPDYDDDGNMTAGPVPGVAGVWGPDGTAAATKLQWDGENQLRSVTVGSTTVTYSYDYLGRRISRTKNGNSWHYVYDGWNMIALYYGGLGRTYLWGLDISGTLQGAGGVGGLLVTDWVSAGAATGRYYPLYDGNGNACQYLDGFGNTAAIFRYDAFGRMLYVGGTNPQAAHSLRFRFSTKYRDFDTGLYYYGYRYLDPATGRWMSRDPIGEMGGVNLYGFVRNDAATRIDLLGLTQTAGDYLAEFDSNEFSRFLYDCEVVVFNGHHQENSSHGAVVHDIVQAYLGKVKTKGCARAIPLACGTARCDPSNGSPGCKDALGDDCPGNFSNIGGTGRWGTNGGMFDTGIPSEYLRPDAPRAGRGAKWGKGAVGFAIILHNTWRSALLVGEKLCKECCCDEVVVRFEHHGTKERRGELRDLMKRRAFRMAGMLNQAGLNYYGLNDDLPTPIEPDEYGNPSGGPNTVRPQGLLPSGISYGKLPRGGERVVIPCKR